MTSGSVAILLPVKSAQKARKEGEKQGLRLGQAMPESQQSASWPSISARDQIPLQPLCHARQSRQKRPLGGEPHRLDGKEGAGAGASRRN